MIAEKKESFHEEESYSDGGIFTLKNFWYLPAGLVLFFVTGYLGFFDEIMTINGADYYMMLLIVFVPLLRNFDAVFQNASPKGIWSNGFTSICGKRYISGVWLWYKLNSARVGSESGITFEKNQGIFAGPIKGTTQVGQNIVSLVATQKSNYEELPINVRNDITQTKRHPPYKFGMIDESQYLKEVQDKKNIAKMEAGDPTAGHIEREIRRNNEIHQWRFDDFHGLTARLKDRVKTGAIWEDVAKGKESKFSKLKKNIFGKEDELTE